MAGYGDGRMRTGQRYLQGPQSRRSELVHAVRIFQEYFRGLRTLHFLGPCVTVFGSARPVSVRVVPSTRSAVRSGRAWLRPASP